MTGSLHTPRPHVTLDDLLGRLNGVKRLGHNRAQAQCPAHDDRDPSMTVREGTIGLLMHCFAGCSFEDILKALDLHATQVMYETLSTSVVRKPAWAREAEAMRQLNLQERETRE